MYRYLTEDEIVTQLTQTLKLKTRKAIVRAEEHDLGMFFSSVGQSIINQYKLDEPNNPLTEKWHKFPHLRHIVGALDYSDDHPDAVAMHILMMLRRRLIQLGIK